MGEILPHRRTVKWHPNTLARADMSVTLRNSSGSVGTVSDCSKYRDELETLIIGNQPATIISNDETVEDPSVFALEEHLESFLIKNWGQTELGKQYDILEVDGEKVIELDDFIDSDAVLDVTTPNGEMISLDGNSPALAQENGFDAGVWKCVLAQLLRLFTPRLIFFLLFDPLFFLVG